MSDDRHCAVASFPDCEKKPLYRHRLDPQSVHKVRAVKLPKRFIVTTMVARFRITRGKDELWTFFRVGELATKATRHVLGVRYANKALKKIADAPEPQW